MSNIDLPSVVNASIHYIFLERDAVNLLGEINRLRSSFESRVKGEENIFDNTDMIVEKIDTNIRISQAKLKLDNSTDSKYF